MTRFYIDEIIIVFCSVVLCMTPSPLLADSVFSGNSWLRDNDNDWKSGTSQSSVSKLAEAARAGDVDAMRKLGMMSMKGQKVKKSAKIAIEWWEKAAKKGDEHSMMYLGDAYRQGAGVHTSPDKAMKYYADAFATMQKGNRSLQSQNDLPIIQRIKKLPLSATIDWWKKRCKQGDTHAMYYLGSLKENEHGTVLTEVASREYLILAAKKGHPKAKKKIEKAPKEEYIAYWNGSSLAIEEELSEGTGDYGLSTFEKVGNVACFKTDANSGEMLTIGLYTVGKTDEGHKYGSLHISGVMRENGKLLKMNDTACFLACKNKEGFEKNGKAIIYGLFMIQKDGSISYHEVKVTKNSFEMWDREFDIDDVSDNVNMDKLKIIERQISSSAILSKRIKELSLAYNSGQFDNLTGNSLEEGASDNHSASLSTDSFEQALAAGSYPDWFVDYAHQNQVDIKAHHSIRNKRRSGSCSFAEIIKEYMDIVSRLRDQLGGRIPSTDAVETVISAGDRYY